MARHETKRFTVIFSLKFRKFLNFEFEKLNFDRKFSSFCADCRDCSIKNFDIFKSF